uniref:Uncharacterized protein n=1 Tax=viral metagenome TaxID=1070528 RepID=A0A6C0DUF4_9ZZZZ
MDANQLGRNSSKYNDRNNLQISNADLFISNNNNPFLISPYAPPANVAKQTTVVNIDETISTLIGNLSSVINLSTFTLSISTIRPVPSDPNQEITIIASTLRLDVVDTVIHGTLEVDGNSKFNNISTGYLFASVADISSLNVSTFNANTLNISNFQASTITVSSLYGNNAFTNSLSTGQLFASVADISSLSVSSLYGDNAFTNSLSTGQLFASVADISSLNISTMTASGDILFSTLIGSTITANTMTIHSTLNVSSIDATGHISFVTMSGSTITGNTFTVHSTLYASTVSTGNINFLTLDGGKGTISEFTFSSINMVPGVISTAATTLHSSFIINIGASKYKIPLEKI